MTDVAWFEVLLRSNQPDRHMGIFKEYLAPGTLNNHFFMDVYGCLVKHLE